MKGLYITDHITTIEHLNKVFESIFKGSKFNCSSNVKDFYTIGKGIVTDDFFIGNFVTNKLATIEVSSLNDCVISMPRLGYFDTTTSSKSVKNQAHVSGNVVCSVDHASYHNPSEITHTYQLYINQQDLLNMLEIKYGAVRFENVLKEIHLNNEKVKALFYYVGATLHVVETFASLRESLVAKMNIKEISLLMATDLIGDLLHKKSLVNESPDKKIIIKAEEIMESECENITTIQEIADKVFTSPRNLQKAFKKYRDYTPLQFLKERKLNRAHHLLRDPYYSSPIKSVAIRVGIFDLNRFGKYYFDQFGEYPSETINRKSQI